MNPPANLKTVNDIIRHRRSIKPALVDPDAPIPDPLLKDILENANWAPTHGMTEPWRFHLFTGDARQRLAHTLQAIYKETTPAENIRSDKLEKLGTNPLLAPLVIAIVMHRQDIEKIAELDEIAAVACAVQNMHLTASTAGLAAFWSSPPLLSSPQMNAFLKIGPKDKVLGLFYLGWPLDKDAWPQSTRHPIEEKLTWHKD
ncbi:MAG: nitroreductase [Verrucomicrobiota bacterium]